MEEHKIQIGTVDGLVNISDAKWRCYARSIQAFTQEAIDYSKKQGIALGTAFQRFTIPVVNGKQNDFNIKDIDKPVYTDKGKEQSPAILTYCKKMGLVYCPNENIFSLTPLATDFLNDKLSIEEFAFVILSKQGIFFDEAYRCNLLAFIASILRKTSFVSEDILKNELKSFFGDASIIKTRFDIILNGLETSSLLRKNNNSYCIASLQAAYILNCFYENQNHLSKALLDTDANYCNYIGDKRYGVYDLIQYDCKNVIRELFPNLAIPDVSSNINGIGSWQRIFYGAPGTGKSNYIEKETKGEMVERTTFHPDSDYSTFVGAYKPTTIDVPMRDVTGKIIVEGGVKVTEKRIVYNFIPQAFLKAYTGAWKNQGKPFYLIIEEINRGNCAQIFGDLFQLLDRNEEGESVYPISPDTDIQKFLQTDSEYGFAALTEEQTNAIPEKVRKGEVLVLPRNLFIWATMNTSDQSLFPIDSAFKRRWDWQYVPISDAQKNWQIEANGKRYDWWEFLQKINDKIGVATNSEDKKLGYFFCKANNDGIIDAETFVGKVIFYIWNDVFKDFADEAGDLFKDEEGNLLSFGKFYTAGIDGKAKVVEEKVTLFLEHLGVGIVDNDDDEEADDEAAIAHRKASIISIQIPGNPTIFTKDSSVIEAFAKALSQIGIERIIPVIGNLKYKRLNCPVLSTEKYPPIEKDVVYSYVQEGNLYVVKGCKQYTYIRILEDLNQMLNIGLSLVTK